jgi:hypothetical protein
VVRPATLQTFEHAPPPLFRGRWEVTAVKLRSCDYKQGSLRWYLGDVDASHQLVTSRFGDPPQLRGVGMLLWEDILIDLAPVEVIYNSHATVLHWCRAWWRWWPVESVFYLPEPHPNSRRRQ